MFDRYRLIERIAVGASAEVFRAASVKNLREQIVALKRILPQRSEDPSFRRAFAEEAAILQTIDHPNVIRLLDFGEMHGTPFIALEFVDGADLGELLGDRIDPPIAAFIAVRVCRALSAVHACRDRSGRPLQIVHRDVSPQNILISARGEVKLTDFGIAKSLLRDWSTQDGSIRGKFDYLAPEQAEPGSIVDARADLFALGAVLHQLLYGRPPFSGASEVETLERLRRGDLVLDLDGLAREHRPLADIALRCLSHQPERRHASAAELEADLEAYCSRHPIDADAVARWMTEKRPLRSARSADDVAQRLLGCAEVEPEEPRDTELVAMTPATVNHPGAALKLALAASVSAVALGAVLIFRSPEPIPAPPPPAPIALAPKIETPPPPRPDPPIAPRPAPRRTRREFGQISINSIPWARVYIDGRFVGETPIRNKRVHAGSRVVELRDAGGKRLERFVASVRKGEKKVHSFDGTTK